LQHGTAAAATPEHPHLVRRARAFIYFHGDFVGMPDNNEILGRLPDSQCAFASLIFAPLE
jgi:hypothetical protein